MKQLAPKIKVDEKSKAIYITTSQFRVSFPKLVKAEETMSGKKQFSLAMLFPKKHDRKYLIDAVKTASQLMWGTNQPKKIDLPFKDGDTMEYAGYEGMMALNGSSQETSPVSCLDRNRMPMDPSKIYAGCWARASITIKAYEVKGPDGKGIIKRGVTCYVQGVQFIADDEAFGSKRDVAEDFGDDELPEVEGFEADAGVDEGFDQEETNSWD